MEQKLPVKKSLVVPRLSHLSEINNAGEIARIMLDTISATPIAVNNWPGQFPPSPHTDAYLAHDGNKIYVLYLTAPDEIRCEVNEDLGPVADDNFVEIFMRRPGSPRYWNFEFNFAGYLNASNRVTRPLATRLESKQRAEVGRFVLNPADFNLQDSFKLMMLVTIPFSLMDLDLHGIPTLMEANLYSLSEKAAHPYYMTWSPIVEETEDFHRPEHFGYLIFQ